MSTSVCLNSSNDKTQHLADAQMWRTRCGRSWRVITGVRFNRKRTCKRCLAIQDRINWRAK